MKKYQAFKVSYILKKFTSGYLTEHYYNCGNEYFIHKLFFYGLYYLKSNEETFKAEMINYRKKTE